MVKITANRSNFAGRTYFLFGVYVLCVVIVLVRIMYLSPSALTALTQVKEIFIRDAYAAEAYATDAYAAQGSQGVSAVSKSDVNPKKSYRKGGKLPIFDRNGNVLAYSRPVYSLYINPSKINARQLDKLSVVLSEHGRSLDIERIRAWKKKGKQFVWIKRAVKDELYQQLLPLASVEINFRREYIRGYPYGSLFSHIVGYANIDQKGLAGLERSQNKVLLANAVQSTLDARVQWVLQDGLMEAMKKFGAKSAAGLITSVKTGDILGFVSLPDFDPSSVSQASSDQVFNRVSVGVYELGSTMKVFALSMALEAGIHEHAKLNVSEPIRIGTKYSINDLHPSQKPLISVGDAYVVSSNIGMSKLMRIVGSEKQRNFLTKMGLLSRPRLELGEISSPILPNKWGPVESMTISYGYGLGVSLLQLSSAFNTVMNGGVRVPLSLLAYENRSAETKKHKRLLSKEVSKVLRRRSFQVIDEGNGWKAGVAGYAVGGKTGTSYKWFEGKYSPEHIRAVFVAAFPIEDPEYSIAIFLEEPQLKDDMEFLASSTTAAPTVGDLLAKLMPVLGVKPRHLYGS